MAQRMGRAGNSRPGCVGMQAGILPKARRAPHACHLGACAASQHAVSLTHTTASPDRHRALGQTTTAPSQQAAQTPTNKRSPDTESSARSFTSSRKPGRLAATSTAPGWASSAAALSSALPAAAAATAPAATPAATTPAARAAGAAPARLLCMGVCTKSNTSEGRPLGRAERPLARPDRALWKAERSDGGAPLVAPCAL